MNYRDTVLTFWREVDDFEECAASERDRLEKTPFDPEQARKKRLEFLETYGKVIGVTSSRERRPTKAQKIAKARAEAAQKSL